MRRIEKRLHKNDDKTAKEAVKVTLIINLQIYNANHQDNASQQTVEQTTNVTKQHLVDFIANFGFEVGAKLVDVLLVLLIDLRATNQKERDRGTEQ
jgi:hypothetical protein